MSNDRQQGTTFEGKSDMQTITGAVIGLVFAWIVLIVLRGVGFFKESEFTELWGFPIVSVFAIVGAVVGGTKAILAKLERMSPEPLDKALQILREKQELPDHIQLPTEEEAE